MDTDIELATLTSLLGLDELEVVESRLEEVGGRVRRRLTLVHGTRAGLCPHCGAVVDERHACHDRVVTDLPMGAWPVALVVRLWQFRCRGCDRFFTPRLPALAEGVHATERLLERLAELASHSDVATAARFFGLPEKTAEGWYYAYLKRHVAPPLSDEPAARVSASNASTRQSPLKPVRSLGIDELSFKKGTAGSAAC